MPFSGMGRVCLVLGWCFGGLVGCFVVGGWAGRWDGVWWVGRVSGWRGDGLAIW